VQNRRFRFQELWLTPLIGLAIITLYVLRHDFKLLGSVSLTIIIGAVPLFATALFQGRLKRLKWPAWIYVQASIVMGYITLYICYYYALYPKGPHLMDESDGNVMTIFLDQSVCFGFIGAFAAFVSAMVSFNWIDKV